MALEKCRVDMLQAVLKQGTVTVDLNCSRECELSSGTRLCTPLEYAVLNDFTDGVRVLLQAGVQLQSGLFSLSRGGVKGGGGGTFCIWL
jgi:hypothetical protein